MTCSAPVAVMSDAPFAEEELGRAAHADELRIGGQLQIADAIAAGRDRERHAVAGGFVDGALERAALVVGAAGAQPELRGVNAERADRRGRRDRRRDGPAAAEPRMRNRRRSMVMAPGLRWNCAPIAAHRDHMPWAQARRRETVRRLANVNAVNGRYARRDRGKHDRFAGADKVVEG